jgi:hypothetical protein
MAKYVRDDVTTVVYGRKLYRNGASVVGSLVELYDYTDNFVVAEDTTDRYGRWSILLPNASFVGGHTYHVRFFGAGLIESLPPTGDWEVLVAVPSSQDVVSAAILYRGKWSATKTYYCTSNKKDVVKFTYLGATKYYICKVDGTIGIPPEGDAQSSAKWAYFSANFDSVATGLLLAEDATITHLLTLGADDDSATSYGALQSVGISGLVYNVSGLLVGGLYNGNGFLMASDSSGSGYFRIGQVNGSTVTNGIYWDGPHSIFGVETPNFKIKPNGDVLISGLINATVGQIGGWTVSASGIFTHNGIEWTGMMSSAPNDIRYYAGAADAAGNNATYYVTCSGLMHATLGDIGNWKIDNDSLTRYSNSKYSGMRSNGTAYRFFAGATDITGTDSAFSVNELGEVVCSAITITGGKVPAIVLTQLYTVPMMVAGAIDATTGAWTGCKMRWQKQGDTDATTYTIWDDTPAGGTNYIYWMGPDNGTNLNFFNSRDLIPTTGDLSNAYPLVLIAFKSAYDGKWYKSLFQNVIYSDVISTATLSAIKTYTGNLTIAGANGVTTGYIACGQSGYDTGGAGFWMGYTGGYASFSIGNPAGNKMLWNGTAGTLTITGTINVTGGNAAKADATNLAGRLATDPTPSETGLYLGATNLGYWQGTGGIGVWKTYMNNDGDLYLSGSSGGDRKSVV